MYFGQNQNILYCVHFQRKIVTDGIHFFVTDGKSLSLNYAVMA